MDSSWLYIMQDCDVAAYIVKWSLDTCHLYVINFFGANFTELTVCWIIHCAKVHLILYLYAPTVIMYITCNLNTNPQLAKLRGLHIPAISWRNLYY